MKALRIAVASLGLLGVYWICMLFIPTVYMLELSDSFNVVLSIVILFAYMPGLLQIIQDDLCDQASRLIVGVFYVAWGLIISGVWRLADRAASAVAVGPRDAILDFGLALVSLGLFLNLLAADGSQNRHKTWKWGIITIIGSIALGLLTMALTKSPLPLHPHL